MVVNNKTTSCEVNDQYFETPITRKINVVVVVVFLCIMINFNLGDFRYSIALPLLLIIWFLYVLETGLKLTADVTYKLLTLVIITLILGLPSLFEVFTHKANLNYTYLNYSLSVVFKLFSVYTVIICCIKWANFDTVINKVLFINILFFYIQFFLVYLTGYYLDFLELTTGETQRYNSLFSIPILGNIYRPTGFYEEPSTYSSIIMVLVACKLYVNKQVNKTVVFSIVSMILSLSVASVVYGAALGLYLMLKSRGSYFKYIPFLLLPFIFYGLASLVFLRLDSVGNATDLRSNLIYVVFEQQYFQVLFGNGVLGVVDSLAEYVKAGNLWKAGVVTLNDNGLWLFIIMKFGLLGLIAFSFAFTKRLTTNLNLLLFLIVMLSKVSFLYFIFIFYLSVVYYLDSDSSDSV